MTESVFANAIWRYDYIDHYRLDEAIIGGFLYQKWGGYKYFVKRKGEEFRFWVPRALTKDEKNELIGKRKPKS
ncbi:hypothetical protein JMJ35_000401 [Cladonia borealis]|uniref:Uncharacterized protein n=1 Tax=Cladonia borealis TaxID=184061 RepID=A0AA39RAJ1_9LECA|nr:hypothetical protein JMJ35_000401 [Cladonia borealis]